MAFQYVDYPQKMKDLLMQIFDDSFMQANTRFQSFEGFRYSSAVFVNWNSTVSSMTTRFWTVSCRRAPAFPPGMR